MLALTLAWELPWAAAFGWWRRRRPAWLVLVAIAANMTSHGAFFLLWPHLGGGFTARLTAAEIAVTVFEAAVYRLLGGLPTGSAVALSVLANATSLAAGLLIR